MKLVLILIITISMIYSVRNLPTNEPTNILLRSKKSDIISETAPLNGKNCKPTFQDGRPNSLKTTSLYEKNGRTISKCQNGPSHKNEGPIRPDSKFEARVHSVRAQRGSVEAQRTTQAVSLTRSRRTRKRDNYVSKAYCNTPFPPNSQYDWLSLHKGPYKQYSSEWYEFIYSTEESNPYYSCSWFRTSAVWKKIRNTRSTLLPYHVQRRALKRARARFEEAKRKKAHEEWKQRNLPKSLSDEDYRAYIRKILWQDSEPFGPNNRTTKAPVNDSVPQLTNSESI